MRGEASPRIPVVRICASRPDGPQRGLVAAIAAT
jgi:hypothetical protein